MVKDDIGICREETIRTEVVESVTQQLLSDSQITALAETFKLLADPTRLRIVLALGKEELCVCELSKIVGVSVSAISHQLRRLREMRIVKFRKAGKIVFYSLDDEHIENVIHDAQTHIEE
ncbi:MAG: metalloregulator ArsR/SmtB family transcription factor [Calditrichia bacterium]